jgi:ATP-binding cassette subfamily C protein EexD
MAVMQEELTFYPHFGGQIKLRTLHRCCLGSYRSFLIWSLFMSKLYTSSKPELKQVFASLRMSFVFVGIFSFFINILMLVPPIYMLQVYDRVMTSRSEETLLMITLIVVWMFITMGLLDFTRSRMLIRISAKMDDRLSTRIYEATGKASLVTPGSNTAQAMGDLTSLRQFMTGTGPLAFFDLPWVPIYFVILYLFHPWLAYFALFAAAILIFITLLNSFSTSKPLEEAQASSAQSSQLMQAQLRNSEVVHAMGMSRNMLSRWLQTHLESLKSQGKASDRAAIWANMSKTLRMMFQSLMLGLGGYLAISNEISGGMVIAGSILMGRALAPIDQLLGAWKPFSAARASHKRLNELLTAYPAEAAPMSLPPPTGAISAEQLMVMAPGTRTAVLQGIHFSINAGEALVVLGPSAAGKSSLIRAIVGVWPSVSGSIRLDGTEVGHWNREELGPYIGYLPQDVELFGGTVAENISRFGETDSTKIVAAAKAAGVDELIRHLPDGYDTRIGIGGSSLSGGQRQRIGLARALYGSPSLIILDEPNANLDDVGERCLIEACVKMKKEGTSLILVTHRPNILPIADKILMLVDGKMHMFGARDQVLQELSKAKAPLPPKKAPAPPATIPPATVVNIPR